MGKWTTAALLAACIGVIPGCAARHDASKLAAQDLEGRPVHPLQSSGSRAVVLVFARTDCPISNRYAPEVRRLHEKFSGRGVVFWLVYCDPDESVDEIRAHAQDYAYPVGILRDPSHDLVRMTGVHVTPEAAIFVPRGSGAQVRALAETAWEMVYRGRIDDRYVDFGRMRPEPTVNDLERALDAILAGRSVPEPRTEAIGCFIEASR